MSTQASTPTYIYMDEPQDDADRIALLRAHLRSMTDMLERVIEDGPPPRGRSLDDKQAHDVWHEDRWIDILRAREALRLTQQ